MAAELQEISAVDRGDVIPFPVKSTPELTHSVPDVRKFLPHRTRNEFAETKNPILKPLEIKMYEPNVAEKVTTAVEKDFEYYSAVYDLEVDTERTKVLEGIVDKMSVGTGIDTRVVIMTRGRAPNGFVTPDGTIFISQSLINRLDSMDEIAAVLAHEFGHLVNKTSLRVGKAGPAGKGVGFAHEIASDWGEDALLEKSGYRTWASTSAILKIQGFERGVIHQSGLTRSSMAVGHHAAVDRQTSSQSEVPIPKELKGKLQPTNLEIVTDKLAERNSVTEMILDAASPVVTGKGLGILAREKLLISMRPMFEDLHPRDLGEAYRTLSNNRHRSTQGRQDLRTCNELISDRLKELDFSQTETNLFLATILEQYGAPSSYEEKDGYLFKEVSNIGDAIDLLVEYDPEEVFAQTGIKLFDTEERTGRVFTKLLVLMSKSIYDINFRKKNEGIPVTFDSLLDNFEKISQLEVVSGNSFDQIANGMTAVIARYVNQTYLEMAKQAKTEIDEDQLTSFFQEIRARNIKIIPTSLITELKLIRNSSINIDDDSTNVDKVIEVIKQVYELEKPFSTKDCDEFFDAFVPETNDRERADTLIAFLKKAQEYFSEKKIDDTTRLFFADYLKQKINSTTFTSKQNLARKIDLQSGYDPTEETDAGMNDFILKFNLLSIIGVSFFEKDSEEFYNYIQGIMPAKGSKFLETASKQSLISLSQPLLGVGGIAPNFKLYGIESEVNVHVDSTTSVEDYKRFLSLPFIEKIASVEETLNISNMTDLVKEAGRQNLRLYAAGVSDFSDALYGDRLTQLLEGKKLRESFEVLLQQGIPEQDSELVYDFIDRYYPEGSQKNHFLRELNKLYLHSSSVSFEQKVDYMISHFDQVGPEAMIIIADQIEDIVSYRYFRQRVGIRLDAYLEGKDLKAVNTAAVVDFAGSEFVKDFEKLLATCQDDTETRKNNSTELASDWFKTALNRFTSGQEIDFDEKTRKFVLNDKARSVFRTLGDTFDTLRGLTDLQKFFLIHKSLTDTHGALTSPENRKKMADILLKSLKLKPGFISSVLKTASVEADPKLLAFPISNMLIPLVFRSLDVNAVDQQFVGDTQLYFKKKAAAGKLNTLLSTEEIANIIHTDTRSVAAFGVKYQNQPDSLAASLAAESDQQYATTTDLLSNWLSKKEETIKTEGDLDVDPSIEAVIKGVEGSGALGIRALQLAAQFHSFSPAIARRLSETFDSNPGLEKLRFWENLNKLATDAFDKGDLEIERYLERITLKNKLGGGSLQTTYAATLDAGTADERAVIVKMKNPNVEAFIQETYGSAHKTLAIVARQWGSKGQDARTGMVLMDLSQKWCIDDINDKTFIEDDAAFLPTVESFNQVAGQEIVYVPDKLFTSSKIKSEDLASGKTANQFLNDESVDINVKKIVVETLSRFFIHQLKAQTVTDQQGKQVHMVHSDPHVGNYMVDDSQGKLKVGVIDRSMYLKLEDADIKALEKMVIPANDNDFVYGFVDRVLDINKVRGIQRGVITARVLAPVYAEYAVQRARGSINKLELMRTMLTAFNDTKVMEGLSARSIDIPLNLRLMIRNIAAFQELGRRYGVDFEALYKQAA